MSAMLSALGVVVYVCLSAAATFDVPTVGLVELAERDSRVLMSCAGDDLPASEPMWCASPDSPLCLPALPKPERTQLLQGPVAIVLPALAEPRVEREIVGARWPDIGADQARALQLVSSLERPPRSV